MTQTNQKLKKGVSNPKSGITLFPSLFFEECFKTVSFGSLVLGFAF
jgi:hypothetical protein